MVEPARATQTLPERNRLGLALSGGGFRAAFFHIGVLARMAELDLLRQVECISTVSGGSVVGAMYYLKVRKLLMQTLDAQISSQAYVDLVQELQREFFEGVSRNLRMRTFSNPVKNWRMYLRDYSRSDRIGELYTRHFFSRCVEEGMPPGIPLRSTFIVPKDVETPGAFHPFRQDANGATANDKRRHKVPALLLNTTTLNTGNNFRFTSTWMGEVPTKDAREEIDQNTRLRRFYIDGRDPIPAKYKGIPLGVAVAASTSVPGIFPPLALTDLYEGWTPQLVDGGVHDNQGIEGLMDADYPCTHMIVSDASGQMKDDPEPGILWLSVVSRANAIMMDRVREEEYGAAVLKKQAGRIRGLVFFHLRQGVRQRSVTWIEDGAGQALQESDRLLPHGVTETAQILLSEVRTDLDSFTEVEAGALMADGYLVSGGPACGVCVMDRAFSQSIDPHRPISPAARQPAWGFLRMAPYLGKPGWSPFSKQIRISSASGFKAFQFLLGKPVTGRGLLRALLPWASLGLLVAVAWVVGRWMWTRARPFAAAFADRFREGGHGPEALGIVAIVALICLLPHLGRRHSRAAAQFSGVVRLATLGTWTAVITWAVTWIHLWIFDPMFRSQGKLEDLER